MLREMQKSPAPLSIRKQTLAAIAVLAVGALAAPPSHAGGMMGGEGGGGGGWSGSRGGGERWEPRRGGRSGYPGAGRWQDCHRFNAASRAAFRNGDYARGNALQDRFYNCMRSRWND
ncbi:hypothetical protein [Methylosinus sp. Sm6]|uniref:hypothetical protein n=1 Tax=Methylosinus sp. Sm6 TaxID=2866948 RepID=UPI001C991761|nr:hypothetical protein [Methylosinus sp. Sm6]MBY6242080.1 hypothetical protein [Methylosinus sp. Sm6]